MKGRDKCELLNEVRQKIAEKNDIEFTVYECTFEGDCTGTCPKCESEVRYLEEELAKKQARGEKINLEGIFNIEETCPKYIEEPPTEEEVGRETCETLGMPKIIQLAKDRGQMEDGDIRYPESMKILELKYRIQELEMLISKENNESLNKEIQDEIDKLTEELEEIEDFTYRTTGIIAPDEEL